MGTLRITKRDVSGMVGHWLATPVGAYLGSFYGSDLKSVLQNPMGAGVVDGQIAKLRVDVPLVNQLPAGSVNVYAYDADIDKKALVFDIGGELLDVDGDQFAPQVAEPVQETQKNLLDTVNESSANALHTTIHVTLPYPGYW